MIISDMNAGNGLCLLDPHGELVDTIIESIPSNRINDVILFDLSDTEYDTDQFFTIVIAAPSILIVAPRGMDTE